MFELCSILLHCRWWFLVGREEPNTEQQSRLSILIWSSSAHSFSSSSEFNNKLCSQQLYWSRTTKVWPKQLDPTTLICFHSRQLKSQFHQMFGLFLSSDSWSGALKNSHKLWSKCANRVLFTFPTFTTPVCGKWKQKGASHIKLQDIFLEAEALYLINDSNRLNLGIVETALPKISKTFMLT